MARRNYRNRQIGVYLLSEFHSLALFPVDVDHEAVHLTAEPAYEPRDHGLVRAAHLHSVPSTAAPATFARF